MNGGMRRVGWTMGLGLAVALAAGCHRDRACVRDVGYHGGYGPGPFAAPVVAPPPPVFAPAPVYPVYRCPPRPVPYGYGRPGGYYGRPFRQHRDRDWDDD